MLIMIVICLISSHSHENHLMARSWCSLWLWFRRFSPFLSHSHENHLIAKSWCSFCDSDDFLQFSKSFKSFKMVHFAKKIGFNRNFGHSTLSWSHYFLVIFWRFSKMSQLFSRVCPLGYSIAILLLYIAYSNSTTTHTWPFTILMEN